MVQLGYGPARQTTDNEYKFSDHGIKVAVTIASTASDAGNTPATTLRKGLVLGKVTATGKFKQYSNGASDGTEVAAGILDDETNLLDAAGTAGDSQATMLIHGYVRESKLHGIDANGKADLSHVIFG
jgi:hypothetical protein